MSIDSVVAAVVALFLTVTGLRPRYKVDGSISAENLALQNIQVRLRMVLAFLFSSPCLDMPIRLPFLAALSFPSLPLPSIS
ncbi:unnamed protein product [Closterium sp. Naga37s-1]|nr:unnamed protein product [Closterium sp. Naga37s-1]